MRGATAHYRRKVRRITVRRPTAILSFIAVVDRSSALSRILPGHVRTPPQCGVLPGSLLSAILFSMLAVAPLGSHAHLASASPNVHSDLRTRAPAIGPVQMLPTERTEIEAKRQRALSGLRRLCRPQPLSIPKVFAGWGLRPRSHRFCAHRALHPVRVSQDGYDRYPRSRVREASSEPHRS